MRDQIARGIRLAQVGLLVNAALALIKLLGGILGHSGALIADAVESIADIVASVVVWSGLSIAAQPPDESHPFGHGKAEALAAATVALMLLAAAIGIGIEAVRQIRTPHQTPATYTLAILVGVILVKEALFRTVLKAGQTMESSAITADAWHHRSDAITSAAAFVGISIAIVKGPGWEAADDWAALLAGVVILYNAVRILRPAVDELMDRAPGAALFDQVSTAAYSVREVCAIEKLNIRKVGLGYYVDLHVQADPTISLHDAHVVSGKVKSAIRAAVPSVSGALIHMEPYDPDTRAAAQRDVRDDT
jgi:cation diffusion facilitator family transporter